jgi:2-polyprenyl-3-methyl-5-hydroxy-6-metoxy-1,4-benzoquinol methylase
MTKQQYDIYGEMAEEVDDFTKLSGRYPRQATNERRIPLDVIKKVDLDPNDTCLDIGCGPGNIAIPLSFLVEEVVAVDNPNTIDRLEERFPNDGNLDTKRGSFLELGFDQEFDAIVAYSVIPCLPNERTVHEFVTKAAKLLAPGGKLLIGDIPNKDKKNRFLESPAGKEFQRQWEQEAEETDNGDGYFEKLGDAEVVVIDDAVVLSLVAELREQGFHCHIEPQPENLPFGHTREDIIVEKLP